MCFSNSRSRRRARLRQEKCIMIINRMVIDLNLIFIQKSIRNKLQTLTSFRLYGRLTIIVRETERLIYKRVVKTPSTHYAFARSGEIWHTNTQTRLSVLRRVWLMRTLVDYQSFWNLDSEVFGSTQKRDYVMRIGEEAELSIDDKGLPYRPDSIIDTMRRCPC